MNYIISGRTGPVGQVDRARLVPRIPVPGNPPCVVGGIYPENDSIKIPLHGIAECCIILRLRTKGYWPVLFHHLWDVILLFIYHFCVMSYAAAATRGGTTRIAYTHENLNLLGGTWAGLSTWINPESSLYLEHETPQFDRTGAVQVPVAVSCVTLHFLFLSIHVSLSIFPSPESNPIRSTTNTGRHISPSLPLATTWRRPHALFPFPGPINSIER